MITARSGELIKNYGVFETFSVQETAQHLGTTERLIYRYLRDGQLKGKMIGRKWRITPEAVKAFLNG